MKLSICMMVKNEEKNLPRCLDNLKPLIESGLAELIIVDTGSEDESINISKQYTDKVYFHKWNKNFSEMRNISISYAKGEWIFIIDADERLDAVDKLITLFNSKEIRNYNTILLQVKNLYSVSDESKFNLIVSPRIFKNDGKFRYEGAVHNQPIFKGPNLSVDISLTHYGYISNDKELMELKYNRTTELLKSELEKEPENLYYIYQLGVSYDMYGEHKKALEEFRKAYSILNKKSSIEKKAYVYIYASYSRIAYTNNELRECIKVAKESLNLEKNYIDLYYLLGISERRLGNSDEAFEYFNTYLDLTERYNQLEISKDMTIIMYHIDDKSKSTAYFENIKYYLELEKYQDAYKVYKNVTSINEKIYSSINVLMPLKKYSELRKVYYSIISENDKNNFLCTLEEKLKTTDGIENNNLYKEFSFNEDTYGLLNKIRISDDEGTKKGLIKQLIEQIDFNTAPIFYSEVFENIKDDINLIMNTFEKIEVWNLKNIVKYLIEEKNFTKIFEEYVLEHYNVSHSIKQTSILITVTEILLLVHIKDNTNISKKYSDIFSAYIEIGVDFVGNIYKVERAEEIYKNISNQQDRFFVIIYIINELIKENNKKLAVKYMIEAVNTYEALAKYIDIYKNEIFSLENENIIQENNTEFEDYKLLVKENIKNLINQGSLDEAKSIISEYEGIVKSDIEIYSMKAIIYIMENNLEEAEQILINGLKIEEDNFDLNYNLGFVFEQKGQYLDALETYEKIIFTIDDCEQRQELIKYISQLESKYKDIIQNQLNSREDIIIESSHENKIKNLHLMYDSPYCDKLINFMNKNFDKCENKFIIIHNKNEDLKYMNIDQMENVEILDLSFEINKLLKIIDDSSIIFIHYLFDYFCQLVCKYNINKTIYWPIWGGDVYNYIDFELYKPVTKNTLNKLGIDVHNRINKDDINYVYRKATIRKIKKILRIDDGEFEKVKDNFITKAEREDFIYPIPTFDISSIKEVQQIKNLRKKYKYIFLVGNSANSSNNHLDIISQLKKLKTKEFCVLMPLSYGGADAYVRVLINKGKEMFGDRFVALTQYYSVEEYNYILKNVDACFFSYNRQQGLGNIYSAIALGKKVFIDNTKYLFFDINRIKVYNVNEIGEMSIEELIIYDEDNINNNIERLNEVVLNEGLVKNYLQKIFNQNVCNIITE